MQSVPEMAEAVLKQLEMVIYGKRPSLRLALVCLLAKGHILLEDVPGTGKTQLAKALARTMGGTFHRIQGTPDLLPGDVTGSNIFNPKQSEFVFHPGPVFAHVLLMDEVNRATPRAQAALLECMAENQVSVEGRTYELPPPFFVIATQNPVDFEGTFSLPEAQLDRFLMRLSLGYPAQKAEEEMLVKSEKEDPLVRLKPLLTPEQMVHYQTAIASVFVHPEVRSYIVKIVASTRTNKDLVLAAGPRATKGLFRAAQALAAISGRDYVQPDDVKQLVAPILYHRVVLGAEGRLSGRTVQRVVDDSVSLVPAPLISLNSGSSGPTSTLTVED